MLRAGDVYKSVDAQGHTVYSDRPAASAAQQSPIEIGGDPVADVEVHAIDAPPPLRDEDQPLCPEEGFLWTPGYWAWSAAGYYWLPGDWVPPPGAGLLWTPGYWGYADAVYVFHRGYWAPHIGYYGGINYGFGYFGHGFAGGRWVGGSFSYNRNFSKVDANRFRHTYSEAAYNNSIHDRVSYEGRPGGAPIVQTAQEKIAATERHLAATPLQREKMVEAARIPALMPQTFVKAPQTTLATERAPHEMAANTVIAHPPAQLSRRGMPATPPPFSHEYVPGAPQNRVAAPQSAVAHPKVPTLRRSMPARMLEPRH
ncbi:MAG: DUF4124 domain-containing protein [Steroidobacteraceae bacterium]